MNRASTFVAKKILVTGAAGFIGGHVAATLAAIPCRLTLLDKTKPASRLAEEHAADVSWHAMSILQPEFIAWCAEEKFDYVLHFAGNANVGDSVAHPVQDFDVNVRASLAMLEAIRLAKCETVLLYASSAAVYGNPGRLPIAEDDATVPISPYGVGKLAMERYLAVYCRLYGLRGASVRMFSPFGPRLRKQIVFDLMQRIHASPPALHVFGSPTQTRDFIYIDDVVEGILRVLSHGQLDGTTYNIGRGIETPIADVAEKLTELMRPGLPITYERKVMPGYPDNWRADIRRLSDLGWQPRTTLADGLHQTVEWYSREHS